MQSQNIVLAMVPMRSKSIRVTFTSGWWFILFTIKHNGSHAESRGTPYVVFRQQF